MPRTPNKPTSIWAQVGLYTSLGFILPAGALLGFVIGSALDDRFHTKPLLAIVIGFLGGAGGFIEIMKLLARAERNAGGNDDSTGTNQS